MRKLIITAAGIVILGIGFLGMKGLSSSKKSPEKKQVKSIKSVYSQKVKNATTPISITTSGSILAKDRMVIFSEVQGIFMPSGKSFKAGTNYGRGQSLIRINNQEFNASVIAQRSSFKNLINSILPDIQFDYPESLQTWKDYLNSINLNSTLPTLPKSSSEKEKNFIIGKNINSTYYGIKNIETRLRKYNIYAPYTGVLVQASATPGTLISPGQKLGEFIRPNLFELELNVNTSLQAFLKKGKIVELSNIEKTKTWKGKVTRINSQIDRNTQTIKTFVEIYAKDLKEGEYLEANIFAKEIENSIEIPNTLIVNDNSIYLLIDNRLKLQKVDIIFNNTNSVVIKGLKDGIEYLSKPIPGAFDGMIVKKAN